MKIIHRISLNIDSQIQKKLSALSIKVDKGFQAFEIDESNKKWPNVQEFLKEIKESSLIYTKFDKKEFEKAKFLILYPSWHCGYPMPDDDNGYLNFTFDLSDYCEKCGIGKVQKAPFKMLREPKWGTRHILQLNWVFDEYFVKPEIWKEIFKPKGIEKIPVLHHKTEKELESVVQLKINHVSKTNLVTVGLPTEKCKKCERIKFLPHTRGKFPRLEKEVTVKMPIFKSNEYWGSGGSAFRAVIINQALYQEINSKKLKGVSFKPVDD